MRAAIFNGPAAPAAQPRIAVMRDAGFDLTTTTTDEVLELPVLRPDQVTDSLHAYPVGQAPA